MRRSVAAAAGLALMLVPQLRLVAQAQTRTDPATPVLGQWLTQDSDGVFQIARCGDMLCGWLVGMRYTGSMPLDVWHRPQCKLALLTKFRPADEPGHWAGSILDPDNGHSYQATIWSPQPDVLKLRGYVLLPMLGETQGWTRYHGTIGPDCKLPG
ncbi:DUF2147 domain-containing protein [Lichenicola sp.]|uniref:DUF2147 domain-containing protein n=1 Tax=Lichenicola sp. TaxID=2804529 RepID=UPI003B00F03C